MWIYLNENFILGKFNMKRQNQSPIIIKSYLNTFKTSSRSLYILRSLCILTDWLTHSLTHSSVQIMLLELGKDGKNILWPNSYKILGSKSPDQRYFEVTTWKFSEEEYFANNDNKFKTTNLSTMLSVRSWSESQVLIMQKEIQDRCPRSIFFFPYFWLFKIYSKTFYINGPGDHLISNVKCC